MIAVKDLKEKVNNIDYDITMLNYEELQLFNRITMLNQHEGKLVRHFKDKIYLVLDFVEHTETGEEMVVYKSMYDNCKKYVRPIDVFLSKVDKNTYPNVEQEYRFEFIEFN